MEELFKFGGGRRKFKTKVQLKSKTKKRPFSSSFTTASGSSPINSSDYSSAPISSSARSNSRIGSRSDSPYKKSSSIKSPEYFSAHSPYKFSSPIKSSDYNSPLHYSGPLKGPGSNSSPDLTYRPGYINSSSSIKSPIYNPNRRGPGSSGDTIISRNIPLSISSYSQKSKSNQYPSSQPGSEISSFDYLSRASSSPLKHSTSHDSMSSRKAFLSNKLASFSSRMSSPSSHMSSSSSHMSSASSRKSMLPLHIPSSSSSSRRSSSSSRKSMSPRKSSLSSLSLSPRRSSSSRKSSPSRKSSSSRRSSLSSLSLSPRRSSLSSLSLSPRRSSSSSRKSLSSSFSLLPRGNNFGEEETKENSPEYIPDSLSPLGLPPRVTVPDSFSPLGLPPSSSRVPSRATKNISPCLKKTISQCAALPMCMYVSGEKRKYCRKKNNSKKL